VAVVVVLVLLELRVLLVLVVVLVVLIRTGVLVQRTMVAVAVAAARVVVLVERVWLLFVNLLPRDTRQLLLVQRLRQHQHTLCFPSWTLERLGGHDGILR